jgi:hypothetical protein
MYHYGSGNETDAMKSAAAPQEQQRRLARMHQVILSICSAFIAQPVAADCPAANRYHFSFTTAPAATLNAGSSYTYVATNAQGQSQNVSLSFIVDGLSSNLVAGIQTPAIATLVNDGGTTNKNLVIGGIFAGRTPDVGANTRIVAAVFTVAAPVRDFAVQINDVDFVDNQYRDWLQVNGTNASTLYTPTLSTPWGTNNSVAGPHSSPSSSQLVGAATVPPVSVTARQSVGTGASGNNSTTGTIDANIIQPVQRVEVRYGNYPLTGIETITGQQAIGIQKISFCPLPELTVVKGSTPFATALSDPNRFNIPGADVIYSLTVSNSNTSPTDENMLTLTDILPPAVTFYNGDVDGTGPLSTNFEFLPGSSGLSMPATSLAYSADNGATFSYTPAAGYDAAVKALKITPVGAMAANSSFTLRFRVRIN